LEKKIFFTLLYLNLVVMPVGARVKLAALSGAQGKRTKDPNSLKVHMGRFSGKPIKPKKSLYCFFTFYCLFAFTK